MAFVQPPAFFYRQPHLVEAIERDPQGANRAFQHRGERDVERIAALLEQPSRLARFVAAFLGQIDVGPAGETILLVPRALAMAEEDERVHMLFGPSEARPLHPISEANARAAREDRVLAELFLDAQQLVVFADVIGAARAPRSVLLLA